MFIIVFLFLMKEITTILNVFYKGTSLILSIIMAITIISLNNKKKDISRFFYLMFIFVFLLWRHPIENNVNFKFYLGKWIKMIFQNRIIFINIIGNLLLFVPLVYYIKGKNNYIIIIALILIFEILQLLTKRGVFDIVDIFLNITGVIIGKGTQMIFARLGQRSLRKENQSLVVKDDK